MGDVKGGPAFTHLSYDDYRVLHANLVRQEKASIRDRLVPYAVFIDPQLGRVGITVREARAQGRRIRVAKLPMSAVIRALETGETRGFLKAVVDADTGQILGCAMLGAEGGELMSIIQVAMRPSKGPLPGRRSAISPTPRCRARSSPTPSSPKASTPCSPSSAPDSRDT